jgi:hypothetical protein
MEFEFKNNQILFDRELSELDEFVIKFVNILDKNKINYVLVSGYIAILFGRSRETEDIDIILEKISFEKFNFLWNEIQKEFECLNTSSPKEAYEEFLLEQTSIRFAYPGEFIPNMEIKFPKKEFERETLDNKIIVKSEKYSFNISNLEKQIAFKLFLGSEKDLEDARHLWNIFKDYLDKPTIITKAQELKVLNDIIDLVLA